MNCLYGYDEPFYLYCSLADVLVHRCSLFSYHAAVHGIEHSSPWFYLSAIGYMQYLPIIKWLPTDNQIFHFTLTVAYRGSQTIWGDRTSGLHHGEHHGPAQWVWTPLHVQWIQTRFTLGEIRCWNFHRYSESWGQRWGKRIENYICHLHPWAIHPQ